MTRSRRAKPQSAKPPRRVVAKGSRGYWLLHDAKARFSELVRRAHREGPQHVTVHGRDEVVVVSAAEFRRLTGNPSGAALVEAMQASPHPEIDLEPQRVPVPVRDVSL